MHTMLVMCVVLSSNVMQRNVNGMQKYCLCCVILCMECVYVMNVEYVCMPCMCVMEVCIVRNACMHNMYVCACMLSMNHYPRKAC